MSIHSGGPQRLRPLSVLFTLFLAGSSLATAQDYAPGFQIRPPAPGITAQTLESISQHQDGSSPAKVWVYFIDKQVFDSETCAALLAEVKAGLNEHSAARRAKAMSGDHVDFYDIPVPDEYVKAMEASGAHLLRKSRWLNAVSLRASIETLKGIAELPFVHKITPVRGFKSRRENLPSSPPPQQSMRMGDRDLFDYGPSYDQLAEIGVVAAHNEAYNGLGVIVAMLDSGFKWDHPAFEWIVEENRILAQYDFVNNDNETMNELNDPDHQHDHGSATWSALGGFYEGELIGPAYAASFILAKTEDISDEQPIEEDNWVAGAEWVESLGADVISSSLGYYAWYSPDDMDGDTAVTTIAADIAVSRGIVVCLGAGNMGDQDWHIVIAPADGDSVIAVGAVDWYNVVAGFSSQGPTADGRIKPEVVARGLGVVCACSDSHNPLEDGFGADSGTSMSCPLVAGCAALLIQAQPSLPPMAIREALMLTADNADTPNNERGWGRINVYDALALISDVPVSPPRATDTRLTVMPNPSHGATRFMMELPAEIGSGRPVRIEVFNVEGRKIWSSEIEGGVTNVEWDHRGADGIEVPAGVYLARVDGRHWKTTAKFVLGR